MKKLLALLLVLVLAVATLSGCAKVKDFFGGIGDKIFGRDPDVDTDGGDTSGLEAAATFVFNRYKNEPVATPSNYDVMKSVTIDGVRYTVEWSADNEAITFVDNAEDENLKTVVVPVKPEADIAYVLKATISDADGNKVEKTFNHTVPKFQQLTFAEFAAAKDGDSVVVKGIVTAIFSQSQNSGNNPSSGEFYIQDVNGDGGYYVCLGKDIDPLDLGIEKGITVQVTGTKTFYSQAPQIKDPTVEIIDSNKVTVEPIDITELYAAAGSLSDEKIAAFSGALVTIKGIEITTQDASSKYYKFKLGTLESYLRISGSNREIAITEDIATQIVADHADHKGWEADVVGVVDLYKGDFYIKPVSADAFTYKEALERTDKEKAEYEIGAIKISSTIRVNTELTLPVATVYDDVTISWTVDNDCAVLSSDGKKLTITLQKTEQKLNITVTAVCGEETVTKVFAVTVIEAPEVVPSIVTEPAVNTAYKLYFFQASKGQGYYLNGLMAPGSSYYLDAETDHEQAKDVYLEETTGGYYIYFMDGDAKKYIDVYQSNGYTNARFVNAPGIVFTFNTEYDVLVCQIEDTTYYLGTYGDYNTFSVSSINKITYSNSYPAHLVTMVNTTAVPDAEKVETEKNNLTLSETEFITKNEYTVELPKSTIFETDVTITWSVPAGETAVKIVDGNLIVTLERNNAKTVVLTATITAGDVTDTKTFELTLGAKSYLAINNVKNPEIGVAYKFYLVQNKLEGKTLYFSGSMSGNFLATTDAPGLGVDVYLEAAETEGTYRLYFYDAANENAKTYIEVYEYEKKDPGYGKARIRLVTEVPTNVYTLNADLGLLVYTADADNSYYMGTYNTYNTISASNLSYISGDKASVIGTSQFITQFATVACGHYFEYACSANCAECGAVNPDVAEHTNAIACDDTCDVCGAAVTPTAEHTNAIACDDTCDLCGADVEHEDHKLSADGTTCEYCGATGSAIIALKVAAEKANIVAPALNYASSAQFIILNKAAKYEDVAIAWTSSNDALVSISGNVVTVKLGAEAATVTLTVTLSCGEGDEKVTESIEYTLTLEKAPTLDVMQIVAPEAGVAYKAYINQLKNGYFMYFKGTFNGSGYFQLDKSVAIGVDVYLEAVEGVENGYRLYMGTGDAKQYIYASTKTKLAFSTTVPEQYFVYNTEINTLTVTIDGADYLIACTGAQSTPRLTAVSAITGEGTGELDVSGGMYPVRFAQITCQHEWAGDCDLVCNICGEARTSDASHTYDNDCDVDCNVCGDVREASHVWETCDATVCSRCEAAITSGEHTWTDCDDTVCDVCPATREPLEHKYDSCDDTDCNECDKVREAVEHNIENGECTKCHLSGLEISTLKADATFAELPDILKLYPNSAQVIVPMNGVKYGDVAIVWTSSDAAVAVDNGILSVTLGAEAKAVTLTAKISVGTDDSLVEKTREYTLELAAVSTADAVKVATFEEGKAYKLYFYQAKKETHYYFSGSVVNTKYLSTTTIPAEAVDVFVEIAESGYRMYFYDGEVKTYIRVYGSGILELTTTVPEEVYTYDATYGIFVYVGTSNTYYLGTYNNFNTIGASQTSYMNLNNCGSSQYPAYLATVICSHSYDADCSEVCNVCGAEREVSADAHKYEFVCSTVCQVCGGGEREIAAELHVYTDGCDKDCDKCSAVRDEVPHEFKYCTDTVCKCTETTRTEAGTCVDTDAPDEDGYDNCDVCEKAMNANSWNDSPGVDWSENIENV